MKLNVQRDVDLRKLNTFGVAARARELVTLDNREQIPELVRWLAGRKPFILGGGSNIVLTRDLDEPVIRVNLQGRDLLVADPSGPAIQDCNAAPQASRKRLVRASAGESWHALVQWTLDKGLIGLENLAWIPGTVGAAPIQNIGAFGVELVEHFVELTAFDLRKGRWITLQRDDCGFGYRDSIFKTPLGADLLITSVTLRLMDAFDTEQDITKTESPLRMDYGDLRREVEAVVQERTRRLANDALGPLQTASARDVAQAVTAMRRRRLPDPAVTGNAGSFFRNPIVTVSDALALQTRLGLPLPQFAAPTLPSGDAAVKLSAAWLIERAGWKGVRHGDAGVHHQHALVLVNHGQASGIEISALAQRIARDIQAKFDIRLETEPRIL